MTSFRLLEDGTTVVQQLEEDLELLEFFQRAEGGGANYFCIAGVNAIQQLVEMLAAAGWRPLDEAPLAHPPAVTFVPLSRK